MRTFIISGIILIFLGIQLLNGGNAKKTIDGDGFGYYSYLLATFVHKTTDFTPVYEIEKQKHSLDYMGHYFHVADGKMFNKYYLGTALMMLPFFLLAWLYSLITGMPPDGYNFLFQYAISLGAAVYAAIGLIATKRFIELFDVKNVYSFFAILILVFGTNIFFYVFLHPSHSHVYSFAAIALFLLFSKRFFISGNIKYIYFAVVFLGIISIIRPTNLLVLLTWPFLAGSFFNFRVKIFPLIKAPRELAVLCCIFLSIFSIQLIYNYIQMGHIDLWSYRNEGFHFSKPAMLSFLFSYRKGFFIYTPLMLLMVPGIVLFFQRSKYEFVTFTAFLLLLVFVLSSWWNWFFGDSFGMRAMIDYYPLLALPLALVIRQFSTNWKSKSLITIVLVSFLAMNLIQTYQYKTGIIHPDSMTKEKYWYVFLKTDASFQNVLGSFPEPVYAPLNDQHAINYFNDMEAPSNLWTSNGVQSSEDAFSGNFLAELSQSNVYSPTLIISSERPIYSTKEIYISISLMFRELQENAASDALLVYAATNLENELTFYKSFILKQLPDFRTHNWRNATFGFKVPPWDDQLFQVKIYVWNKQKTVFQLDDFEVNIHELEKN